MSAASMKERSMSDRSAHPGRPESVSAKTNEPGTCLPDLDAEWLESDGLGGFASGTVGGIRTRRYHAVLLQASRPPTGRIALVNGFDLIARTPAGSFAVSSQRYLPDVVSPDGESRLVDFQIDPWPVWRFRLEQGIEIEQELFVPKGLGLTVLRFSVRNNSSGVRLELRPFLSGRDYHATHHENPVFRFDAAVDGAWVRFSPYPGIPEICFLTNGSYRHEPCWYRNFLYRREQLRGLDSVEDLAAPGLFEFDLSTEPAVMIVGSKLSALGELEGGAAEAYRRLSARERARRTAFAGAFERAGDAYIVRRGSGSSIIAGYPWFTDWGRDTFISLRGLCLATGRLDEASEILVQWAGAVSEGMLPNFFPDGEREPEFNSVDASLWFVVAAHELLEHLDAAGTPLARDREAFLVGAIERILTGYWEGTRYNIQADPEDGLLRAGEPGVQLTWMDAKVGDWVVTPRIGKPVEVEALWINALQIGSRWSKRWAQARAAAGKSFVEKFWNEERGCLFDVVDCDHERGKVDGSIRPNQIFAVGGLPFQVIEGARAARVVECCEEKLLTPVGLRSLAPGEPGYAARYAGGPRERDGAYHQGTVWPWLIGPFVEAWVRVRNEGAKSEARRRFLEPLEERMRSSGGIGHLAEICDAEEPFAFRGCPFQAWSLGELLRLEREVLRERASVRTESAGTDRSTGIRATGRSQSAARSPVRRGHRS